MGLASLSQLDRVQPRHRVAIVGKRRVGLMRHEDERQSVGVLALDHLEPLGVIDELAASKCVALSKASLYPVEFGEGPHVAGKGPDAQSLSRMDGGAVCLSQVQREATDQVATQNRHLTVPR